MGLFDCFKKKKQGDSANLPFSMKVKDVFFIKNHGVVLTGKIGSGTVRVGDTVTVKGNPYKVTLIDLIPHQVFFAEAGQNVGIHLDTMDASLFQRGDTVSKE